MTQDHQITQKLPLTQLDAINIAKALTIVLLISYALYFGINGVRQIIYLCLHITYCVWWLIEQWLFPSRRQQIFQDQVDWVTLLSILMFVGGIYSLPGYLACINTTVVSYLAIAFSIPLFMIGSLINATADIQKLTAKKYNSGLVKDEIWRISQNINYFGDLMRYLSFAIISGSLWSYILPGLIFIMYLFRIKEKRVPMQEKYADYPEYSTNTKQLIPGIW
ncbi:DUF1295 domain-containing protein [Spirulina major]|uniref:DUF1295 domain-containing protein n=1 Tax=Spirulina major TaxID=270636 RepID=UPI000934EAE7|nr:DUF1295 domain-containing protein [Spirulina major]